MATIERAFVASPLATAGQRVITSPFQFYTTGEDRLRVVSENACPAVVLAVHFRTVDAAGLVQASAERHVTNINRTSATTEIELSEGALLNLTVFASAGAPLVGQTFVRILLIRGEGAAAIILGTLVQGYVTATRSLAWPGTPLESSIDGPGTIRTIVGTTPAASAEILETVPTGARWELLTFRAYLVPNAIFAPRTPLLYAATPANNVFVVGQAVSVNAPNSMFYSWSSGLGVTPPAVNINTSQSLPISIPLLAGYVIGTLTDAMAAGDQWSTVTYTVREWLEVP